MEQNKESRNAGASLSYVLHKGDKVAVKLLAAALAIKSLSIACDVYQQVYHPDQWKQAQQAEQYRTITCSDCKIK